MVIAVAPPQHTCPHACTHVPRGAQPLGVGAVEWPGALPEEDRGLPVAVSTVGWGHPSGAGLSCSPQERGGKEEVPAGLQRGPCRKGGCSRWGRTALSRYSQTKAPRPAEVERGAGWAEPGASVGCGGGWAGLGAEACAVTLEVEEGWRPRAGGRGPHWPSGSSLVSGCPGPGGSSQQPLGGLGMSWAGLGGLHPSWPRLPAHARGGPFSSPLPMPRLARSPRR